MAFRWTPGTGIHMAALERMKQHFPRPDKPPVEIHNRQDGRTSFTKLIDTPIQEIDAAYLREYFFEATVNIQCFPALVDEIAVYRQWFHYLLPYCVDRFPYEFGLAEHLTAYCMNVYPRGIREEYPGYRREVLATLGQHVMGAELWNEQDYSTDHLFCNGWKREWFNKLYACLTFCLKYLTPDEISTWIASIAAISSNLWQNHITDWIAGLRSALYFIENPVKLAPVFTSRWRFHYSDDNVETF